MQFASRSRERVNRRVRPLVDGLVAAMAHLWSKFTKCLRPSEGAFDPGFCHPRALPFERTMPRHSLLLHRRYHHLAEATRSPPLHLLCTLRLSFALSPYHSFISLSLSLFLVSRDDRSKPRFIFPQSPEPTGTPGRNEYKHADNEISSVEIIDLPAARCLAVFYLWETLSS